VRREAYWSISASKDGAKELRFFERVEMRSEDVRDPDHQRRSGRGARSGAVMVSELATNALVDSASGFDVVVDRSESVLTVAVTDWRRTAHRR
jgi:hypothetical protein